LAEPFAPVSTNSDGVALSVAIEIALHADPPILADMVPWVGFAGPVVSPPHAVTTRNAAAVRIVDACRMTASSVRSRGWRHERFAQVA
jgi:hypothetical protein